MKHTMMDGLKQLGSKRRGFRFSILDLSAIAVCGLLTWLTYPFLDELSLLFPITLGHFYLFCNVFRIHRNLELIWAGGFVFNVAIHLVLREISWLRILAIQTPLTVFLIVVEMRSGRYHGIFCGKG
ncbi:MAG: hypothetical protein KDA36_08270 [Planctomycetaceae bacterium]|nr:hypothetical protein [Planctomycetaceae bacterium]